MSEIRNGYVTSLFCLFLASRERKKEKKRKRNLFIAVITQVITDFRFSAHLFILYSLNCCFAVNRVIRVWKVNNDLKYKGYCYKSFLLLNGGLQC